MLTTNPVSGNQEKVWPSSDGNDLEIKWAEKISGSWSNETTLSNNSVDDTCPRLSIDADGSTGVVWVEGGSTPKVVYRGRNSSGSWQSSAVDASDGTRSASNPAVVMDGGGPTIAWQEDDSGTTSVVAGGAHDDPWPSLISPIEIGTTSMSGDLLGEANSSSGHLWITWVDSLTQLGYSEYNFSAKKWGPVQTENYSGPSDIPDAKHRVEEDVTGS